MKQVKYILVNETGNENAVRAIRNSHVSAFRHHIVVNKPGRSHGELVSELCRLRRQWPKAKILGVSELDVSASHAPIRVSAAMNALRRELTEYPTPSTETAG